MWDLSFPQIHTVALYYIYIFTISLIVDKTKCLKVLQVNPQHRFPTPEYFLRLLRYMCLHGGHEKSSLPREDMDGTIALPGPLAHQLHLP